MKRFGCIADDFTGASDAASFLRAGGLTVQLFSGVPGENEKPAPGVNAIVIALKTRTIPAEEAVRDSLAAARWLARQDVSQFYFKYCATFDSTPKGNIGPVADALMELLDVPCTLLCPALPVNGRTVEDGILYVNHVPLSETHMKDHPLTPMRNSRIAELIAPQSRYPAFEIHADVIRAVNAADPILRDIKADRFYMIPDYVNEEDGAKIAALFGSFRLLTGGSGLLKHVAAVFREKTAQDSAALSAVRSSAEGTEGQAVLLSGSCSAPTLSQVAFYKAQGLRAFCMDPAALLSDSQTEKNLFKELSGTGGPVLFYSSDSPEKVREIQEKEGADKVSARLEAVTAAIAKEAVRRGFSRIIVAGGETSGAVTEALGYRSFLIGESVAPGVPVMTPVSDPGIRLVLKSGGFGKEDFFIRAIEMTGN